MTLKAVKTIRSCSVVAVPRSGDGELVALQIAVRAVPELKEKPLLELSMPMSRDEAVLAKSRRNAADAIVRELERENDVAFLTLGDPTIYSTYLYVHKLVIKSGYDAIIIPGVPSFCAAAAALGDSLTEAAEPLHIIPASYGCMDESLDLNGTKVHMKSGKSIGKVKECLDKRNLSDTSKMVQNCGMENERVYRTMNDVLYNPDYFSVIYRKRKQKKP
jgi:precorrin-2/cobalt-factor-2 C20-methyltransferase